MQQTCQIMKNKKVQYPGLVPPHSYSKKLACAPNSEPTYTCQPPPGNPLHTDRKLQPHLPTVIKLVFDVHVLIFTIFLVDLRLSTTYLCNVGILSSQNVPMTVMVSACPALFHSFTHSQNCKLGAALFRSYLKIPSLHNSDISIQM